MNQYSFVQGENDLLTLFPQVAAEWDYERNHPIRPENVMAHANRKFWWKCNEGHSWQAAVYTRACGKGCPYCSGRWVLPGYNDLATLRPELIDEWNYDRNELKPTQVTVWSGHKVWWKGKCGHEWLTSVVIRSKGRGCPYCSGRYVLAGFNDLKSRHPKLAGEWNYDMNDQLPEAVHCGSHTLFWWKCDNNHDWKAAVSDRVRGTGCPYCRNKKVLTGYNDFASHYPDLLEEWDYEKNTDADPQRLTYQSRKKVWWKCKLGHEWRTEIYHRAKGNNCPICGRDRCRKPARIGVNDILSCRPDIANDWDYERNGDLLPEQFSLNSQRKVWWKCKNNHHWRCIIQDRIHGRGCPYCAGKRPNTSRIL